MLNIVVFTLGKPGKLDTPISTPRDRKRHARAFLPLPFHVRLWSNDARSTRARHAGKCVNRRKRDEQHLSEGEIMHRGFSRFAVASLALALVIASTPSARAATVL